jgi:hypothetical protein
MALTLTGEVKMVAIVVTKTNPSQHKAVFLDRDFKSAAVASDKVHTAVFLLNGDTWLVDETPDQIADQINEKLSYVAGVKKSPAV